MGRRSLRHKRMAAVGWQAVLRTGFLRELGEYSANARTAVRRSDVPGSSYRQHHVAVDVQWEDEDGPIRFRGRVIARHRARDGGELRSGSDGDRLAIAN